VHAPTTRVAGAPPEPPRVTMADPRELRTNIDRRTDTGRQEEKVRPSGRTFWDVNSRR
jgi:hypothetical protein